MNRRRRQAVLAWGATALVALALASCSSDSKTSSSTTTSARPSSSTSEQTAAERAVLDGYRAYWSAYIQAADPMRPDNPILAEHATGPALETLQKSFLALKSAGKVIRGDFDLAPRLVNVDGDTATVRDCYGDNTGVYDASTGAREDKPSGQRHLATATLHMDGGTWKIERLADEGLGCTAG